MNFLLNLRQINCTRTVCSKKLNGLMYITVFVCIHSSKKKNSVNFEKLNVLHFGPFCCKGW